MADTIQTPRASALAAAYTVGKTGRIKPDGQATVVLQEIRDLILHQVAAWPDTMARVEAALQSATGISTVATPGRAESADECAVLRIDPLKWWLFAAAAPNLPPQHGATLDLSHSRTHIRVTGPAATEFLNRFLPLDLRPSAFPENRVASSVMHHVGITLWHSASGYELFIPRGFALALWQGMVEVAEQFGVEIR